MQRTLGKVAISLAVALTVSNAQSSDELSREVLVKLIHQVNKLESRVLELEQELKARNYSGTAESRKMSVSNSGALLGLNSSDKESKEPIEKTEEEIVETFNIDSRNMDNIASPSVEFEKISSDVKENDFISESIYEITATYVNARECPSTKCEVVTVLQEGDIKVATKITDNKWVEFKDGYYVYGDFAKPSNKQKMIEPEKANESQNNDFIAGSVYEITTPYVNARECPSTKCEIIAVLEKGSTRVAIEKTDGGWIGFENGYYIYGDFAKLSNVSPTGVSNE